MSITLESQQTFLEKWKQQCLQIRADSNKTKDAYQKIINAVKDAIKQQSSFFNCLPCIRKKEPLLSSPMNIIETNGNELNDLQYRCHALSKQCQKMESIRDNMRSLYGVSNPFYIDVANLLHSSIQDASRLSGKVNEFISLLENISEENPSESIYLIPKENFQIPEEYDRGEFPEDLLKPFQAELDQKKQDREMMLELIRAGRRSSSR